MSAQHPVPLKVAEGDGYRDATADEIAAFRAKGGSSYTKWNTANRIACANALLALGQSHGQAWTKAFEQYPNIEKLGTKPRFVFNKNN